MASRKDDPLEDPAHRGLAPVYAIDGEERILVDEAVAAIKQAALPPTARDFNFDAFSGKDAPLARIVEAAQMLPAFAPRRLVLVQHAEKLDLEDSEEFLRYLEDPSPTTVLVLVADKFDARTRLYKAIAKAGGVIRCGRPKPREMPEAVRRRAGAMGILIREPAIRALVDAVGTDMGAAIQALEVLSLYVGPDSGRAITEEDVERVVSVSREESIFALMDAIGTQNRSSALEKLHGILSVTREHPLRVLAMIARHYRNLTRARASLDGGASRADIQSLVGVPPYFLDNLLAQARRQPLASFVRGLSAIAAADRALKGGALADTRAMERLVLGLMRGS